MAEQNGLSRCSTRFQCIKLRSLPAKERDGKAGQEGSVIASMPEVCSTAVCRKSQSTILMRLLPQQHGETILAAPLQALPACNAQALQARAIKQVCWSHKHVTVRGVACSSKQN